MSRSLKIAKCRNDDNEWKKFVFSQEQLKEELEMKHGGQMYLENGTESTYEEAGKKKKS